MTASTEGDWTQPEIVRTLGRIASALERVEQKVDGLHNEFVPREIHGRDLGHVEGRINELGGRLVDVEAEQARIRKEMAVRDQAEVERSNATWRAWVIPVVLIVVAATIGAVVTQLST